MLYAVRARQFVNDSYTIFCSDFYELGLGLNNYLINYIFMKKSTILDYKYLKPSILLSHFLLRIKWECPK